MTCKYGEAKDVADGTEGWAGELFPCTGVWYRVVLTKGFYLRKGV